MKVVIIGYGGMGREIEKILISRGHEIAAIIDENNRADFTADSLKEIAADVAVEFTTPGTAFDNIKLCLDAGLNVVCGTTGWLDRFEEAAGICYRTESGLFYASNYSIGVNIMFSLNRHLAKLMNAFPDYDVTVEETHHTNKKDAPGGTAIKLAEDIVQSLDRKHKWTYGPTVVPGELGVSAVRRSVVPGIHTVTYENHIDSITLTHSAKSREGFAMGAVLAAEFIQGKKGVYSMSDLLGI